METHERRTASINERWEREWSGWAARYFRCAFPGDMDRQTDALAWHWQRWTADGGRTNGRFLALIVKASIAGGRKPTGMPGTRVEPNRPPEQPLQGWEALAGTDDDPCLVAIARESWDLLVGACRSEEDAFALVMRGEGHSCREIGEWLGLVGASAIWGRLIRLGRRAGVID